MPQRQAVPVSLVAGNIISGLVARRYRLRLSQRDVARMIGCAHSEINEWETGKHSPSFASLLRWARALDLHFRLLPYEDRRRLRRSAA